MHRTHTSEWAILGSLRPLGKRCLPNPWDNARGEAFQ